MITLNRLHRKLLYLQARYKTVLEVSLLRALGASVSSNITLEGRHRITIEPGGRLMIDAGVILGDGTIIEIGSTSTLTLHQGVRLRENCTLRCYGEMTIGKGTLFNAGVFCEAIGKLTIGDSVLLAPQVHLYGFEHCTERTDIPIMVQPIVPGCITIGSGAWLGAKAIITNNVRVGEGAIVGAGAVVTKDVPDYAVAVGVPARIARHRLNQTANNDAKHP